MNFATLCSVTFTSLCQRLSMKLQLPNYWAPEVNPTVKENHYLFVSSFTFLHWASFMIVSLNDFHDSATIDGTPQ